MCKIYVSIYYIRYINLFFQVRMAPLKFKANLYYFIVLFFPKYIIRNDFFDLSTFTKSMFCKQQ